MAMRRLLGSALPALLLVAVLGACGDETASDDKGTDPGNEPSATVSSPGGTGGVDNPGDGTDGDPGGSVDFDLVDTITVTAAGGALSEVAVPLTDDAALQAFLSQFENPDMTAQIQAAVAGADVAEGQAVYGAVVAIGCDSPTDVTVTESDAGLVITAGKVPSPMQECFAPMTTVALVVAAA
jgi:hypothetical protein